MSGINVNIVLVIFLLKFLSAFISDEVKEFHFVKVNDGSDEYDFEYVLDTGELFRGRTFILNNPRVHLYIMFGADDIMYWIRFSSYEYLYKKSLSKMVRLAQRANDKITMRDDSALFEPTISTGNLLITPYATKWNLKKICFTKADKGKNTFDYVISSENNSRTLNDTTSYKGKEESGSPLEQRIALVDYPYCDGVYEVKFTEKELQSDETFCKGVSSVISQHVIFGAITVNDVNTNLMKTLMELKK